MSNPRRIAYFSMEIALATGMPTYSGGLGALAGDTIRSAADVGLPMVGVTLLHREGYFYQRLDASGWQTEEPVNWSVDDFLVDTGARASVVLEGRTVQLRAWRRDVTGRGGSVVPVFFLDSDLPENSPEDRNLTHSLYGGDLRDRLCDEVILGIGGVRMLRALGCDEIRRYHMNEGHSALLTIELLRELRERDGRDHTSPEDLEAVQRLCVFTTHTPVPAGHDQFPLELVDQVLDNWETCGLDDLICHEGRLNMTYLALTLSHYVNGVAKKHGEISRHMFAGYEIDAITNGVHAPTWVSAPFRELFDRHVAGWEEDNFSLRYALRIPDDEVWAAHREAKRRLVESVNREANAGFDVDVLTLGFARRAATYKRADMIFHDVERLRRIASQHGGLQLVFAGKAHPKDEEGKIPAELRHGTRGAPDLGLGRLAEHPPAAARSLRHQRHEGGAERRPIAERPGWLVDRGLHRGRDRLGDRHGRHLPGRGIGLDANRPVAVRQARAGRRSFVLRKPPGLHRGHAPRHRAERLVLQHPADGRTVFGQGLSRVVGISHQVPSRGPGAKNDALLGNNHGSAPPGSLNCDARSVESG